MALTYLNSWDDNMALFSTPEQVAAAQQAGALTEDQMINQLRGSFFNLGTAGGRGLVSAFGGDPRTPAELQAAEVQKMAQGLDFTDPSTVATTMNDLVQSGNVQEALSLASLLPKPATPKTTFGDMQVQRVSIKDDSGNETYKDVYYQENSEGKFTKAFEITSSGEVGSGTGSTYRLPSKVMGDVDLDEATATTLLRKFHQAPEFSEGIDTDYEDLQDQGIEGLMIARANQLKQQRREQVARLAANPNSGMTAADLDAMAGLSDSDYLGLAYRQFLESGEYRDILDKGLGVAGADVKMDFATELANQGATEKEIERAQAKRKAIQLAADRTGGLVIKDVAGDPRKGQFSLFNLRDSSKAPQRNAFIGALSGVINQQMSPQEAIQALSQNGFVFSEESLDVHIPMLQMMKENAPIAARFLTRLDNPDEFESQGLLDLEQMEDKNDWVGYAESSRILNYLRNIGRTRSQGEKARKRTSIRGRR